MKPLRLKTRPRAMSAKIIKIEGQLSKLLERILDASVPSVIKAYEEKVRQLELEKQSLKEKTALSAKPASTFDETLRTAFEFLKNPLILWHSGRIEERQLLLKLTFSKRLAYSRKEGFRTANFSLPFKVLGQFLGCESKMVAPDRIRTCGLCLRRAALYPAELRVLGAWDARARHDGFLS